MAGRLNRFLNLEQEHPAREGSRPDVSVRFGPQPEAPAGQPGPEQSVPEPAQTAPPALPPPPAVPYDPEAEAATASLRARRAALTQSGIALDPQGDDQQTFLRCGVCESDNFRHAAKCQSCGSRLDTEEQRLFNRGFWARRRAEDAVARQAEEARRLAAANVDPGPAPGADVAQIAPALARSAAERQRLSWMEPGTTGARLSVGMELLGKIRDPSARQGVMAGLAVAWLVLGARAFLSGPGESHPLALVLFFAGALLFLPRTPRRSQ